MSVFLATYFETNGHFDSNVKLFPVIYANYRPMTDAKTENPATPRQPSCTVSRKHNWTDCGRLGLTLCSRSLLQTVLEMIGRNPGMLFCSETWCLESIFRRCTSLMWLSRRRDATRGRPERLRSLGLPDCLNRLHNDSIVLRWQPQCIAKTLWAPLNC